MSRCVLMVPHLCETVRSRKAPVESQLSTSGKVSTHRKLFSQRLDPRVGVGIRPLEPAGGKLNALNSGIQSKVSQRQCLLS